jgi:transposase
VASASRSIDAARATAGTPPCPHTCRRPIGREAAAVGPATAALCARILDERPHPEQGFRACLGIVRLVRPFGAIRVEAACSRALDIGARTYGSVRSILDTGLDRVAAPSPTTAATPVAHPNIRGPRYYH